MGLFSVRYYDIKFVYRYWIFTEETVAAISLKLSEELLKVSGRCAAALKVSRAAYIRRAIERLNRETRAQLRAKRLAEASRKVRNESMRVNAEFAAIERDPGA